MNTRIGCFVILSVAGIAHAQEPEVKTVGLPRRAFFVEADFGGGGGGPGVGTNLLIGGRFANRVQLAAGVGYWGFASAGVVGVVGGTATQRSDVVSFVPSLAVDLAKTRDDRVALFLRAQLPLGAAISPASPTDFVVGYKAGLGVRWSAHPSLALGLEGGYSGSVTDPGGPQQSQMTSGYAALSGTFYAGRR
jgi:hypothetical protein